MKSKKETTEKAHCPPDYHTFRNREGQTFQLRGDLTLEDVVRMGYTDVRLVAPETPIKPHEWRMETARESHPK